MRGRTKGQQRSKIKEHRVRRSAHLVVRRCGDEVIQCDGGEVKGCVAHVALLFVIVSVGVGSHIFLLAPLLCLMFVILTLRFQCRASGEVVS